MTAGTVHVVGAGLAGLSAAVRLAEGGHRVVVYDSAKAAGGRCRSYHDAALDLTIDNGNHLLLSANHAALDYARLIGGLAALDVAAEADFPFLDLTSGERWSIRPNAGRMPWWIFSPARRVPGTRAWDYLAPARLLTAPPDSTIGEAMACSGQLFGRLWRPVLLAVLNTEPVESSSGLAAAVIRETLGAGGRALRPVVATGGLTAAFVDPALAFLAHHGGEIRLGARVRGLDVEDGRIAALAFGDARIALGPDDRVVLAAPPWIARDLVPELEAPTEFRSIVNAHFRVEAPGRPLVLGLVGGLSEWLFAYPDRLSVTISAADRLLDDDREALAASIWREVARATGLADPMPRWQIVKERRATFAATPAQNRTRPPARTRLDNLVLAGDWTDTGLPATIEGAIRSGVAAAALLQRGDTGGPRSVSKA